MSSSTIWFTVKEKKWKIGFFGKFSWTGKEQLWDSDNCSVSITRTLENKGLIVVRSKNHKYVRRIQKDAVLRYMLGFEISKMPLEPKLESYVARENMPKRREGPKERWVIQLDDTHWIWEWAHTGEDIKNSAIYQLYQEIVNTLKQTCVNSDNIFRVQNETETEEVIPVIYQPSIDSLKNFVQEVHCAKEPPDTDGSYNIEVSILFNNERLRQHGILNTLYEGIRRLLYGRTMDLETFKIHISPKNPQNNHFIFEGIYSDHHEINADSIHGDKKPPPPKHPIKYYFNNQNHPIIFINTSNHAMAEHDTNNKLWKWEYIPWQTNAPIKLGNLTRKQLEQQLKNKNK